MKILSEMPENISDSQERCSCGRILKEYEALRAGYAGVRPASGFEKTGLPRAFGGRGRPLTAKPCL